MICCCFHSGLSNILAEARWTPVQLPPASSFGTAAYLDHLMLFHGEECSQLYSWKLWVAAPISSLSPGPNTIGMVLTCWWKTMSTRRMTAEMISLFSCPAILDGKLWFLLCWIFPSHAHKVFSGDSQQSWTEGVSSSFGLVVCISVRIRFLFTNLLLKVQKMWSKRFHTRNLNG